MAVLTKRPSNINKYIPESWKENPPENVMFGTSPVNQKTADKLIPQLLQVKGKHFLSIEPMLGPVDLKLNERIRINDEMQLHESTKARSELIDWVICGGESGHGARPMHPDWARSIRGQCENAGVPYLFKQWGEWLPKDQINGDTIKLGVTYRVKYRNDGKYVFLGKKEAGRLLDGKTYDEFPEQLTNQNHL